MVDKRRKTPPPPTIRPTIDPEADFEPVEYVGRAGCGLQVLVVLVIGVVALLVVGLAGAAGWTVGTREGQVNAQATRGAAIDEQVARIPADVQTGNLVLLDSRLRWLETQAPRPARIERPAGDGDPRLRSGAADDRPDDG